MTSIHSHSNLTTQAGLSVFVGALPFLEEQTLWEKISHPLNVDTNGNSPPMAPGLSGKPFPAMGPAPNAGRYLYGPWTSEISALRCPSDPGSGLPAVGRTNYASCIGDNAMNSWIGYTNFELGEYGPIEDWVIEGNKRFCRGPFIAHKSGEIKWVKPLCWVEVAGRLRKCQDHHEPTKRAEFTMPSTEPT